MPLSCFVPHVVCVDPTFLQSNVTSLNYALAICMRVALVRLHYGEVFTENTVTAGYETQT